MAESYSALLAWAASRLAISSDAPQLEAQAILAHVTGHSRTWVLAHAENTAGAREAEQLVAIVGKLEAGEPLPYLLGHQEFFGLDFELTPDVLIPRPETELLVQSAISWLRNSEGRRTVADVGTGSGCIGISIAVHIAHAHILATDISRPALEIARANAQRLGVADRIQFVECDILPSPQDGGQVGPFMDLLCSNLPYIPSAELRALPQLAREPLLALDGGPDGLAPFRRLFALAPARMAAGGLILLEIEARSGPAVLSLAYDAFHSASIHLHKDLAGRDRLLEIQLNGGV